MTKPLASNLPQNAAPGRSGIISAILVPAVQLWLRSQVERVDSLQVNIASGDRQILSGSIHQIALSAQNAVYRGLHLGQIHLVGTNIHINLRQVLKGQPLRLLEAVPVAGEIRLGTVDLNRSLQSLLLANALKEWLRSLLPTAELVDLTPPSAAAESIEVEEIEIHPRQLTLKFTLASTSGDPTPLILRTGLRLASPHELELHCPQWLLPKHGRSWQAESIRLDLGSDVALQALTLDTEQLVCRGQILVCP